MRGKDISRDEAVVGGANDVRPTGPSEIPAGCPEDDAVRQAIRTDHPYK
ncbi:hypothetical protein NKF06_07740 [Haloferax sp. AB510]|nr:hypothetical protein [Haloferax sp. AB510]MCO8266475.1 hypothetical protein [Haloferax sp. AB510]